MYQEGTDHLIWSNYHTDFEDWKESTSEDYEDYSEDRLYEIFCEAISDFGTADAPDIRRSKAAISVIVCIRIRTIPLGM